MHINDSWILVDSAPNSWIGTIENEAGDEIADLSTLAVFDFTVTFNFATGIVEKHNAEQDNDE
jgi:hypothetical protein